MTESRITYAARPDATPEAELSALAAVYKFVLAKKQGGPDQKAAPDAKKGSLKHEVRATQKHTG